jgi:hypothetical protein
MADRPPDRSREQVNFNAHRTMANLTTTYFSRVLCKMDERKRLADIGIDVRRSDAIFPAWDELGEIPKVSLSPPQAQAGSTPSDPWGIPTVATHGAIRCESSTSSETQTSVYDDFLEDEPFEAGD